MMNTLLEEFDSFCRMAIDLNRIDITCLTNPATKYKFIDAHLSDILKIRNNKIEHYYYKDPALIPEFKSIALQYLTEYKAELQRP